ncbi:MAG: transposase zinc-binding domain-containing protein, partial [Betaproteobacteria bacterium]|nr:transposase zinc-binding domain-containing protein [Betaproteobacteria bacterium]
MLYRLVQQHAAAFFAQAEDAAGAEQPQFVKDEFDAFLECGILAHGFLRLRCGECGHDKLVAFSCKRRGLCPSCGARRMYLPHRRRPGRRLEGADGAGRTPREMNFKQTLCVGERVEPARCGERRGRTPAPARTTRRDITRRPWPTSAYRPAPPARRYSSSRPAGATAPR